MSRSSDFESFPSQHYQAQFHITNQEFEAFRSLIYHLIGIQLNEQKKMLVISRLSRRLRQLNLNSFSEYLAYLDQSSDKEDEIVNLINQMTTNKTDFFREGHHFDFLRNQFMPHLASQPAKNIRIWSAGCSSGEEPYTMAMVVDDFLRNNPQARIGLDLKILATDVDTNVLAHARTGIYQSEAIAPIPANYRNIYFNRTETGFQVSPRLQSIIAFKRFNLMHDFPFRYGFNLIFCRNVLIYFSQEDRLKIVRKFHSCLRPGGYLILGHSESLLADNCGFVSLGNTIYLRN